MVRKGNSRKLLSTEREALILRCMAEGVKTVGGLVEELNVSEATVRRDLENLEQQGIKIEAVEVTVASHEFDRSYEENSDQNELQDEMQEELKKTRKIDVSAFTTEEEIEELDESEQVTAKMMRADGNSMDYKV